MVLVTGEVLEDWGLVSVTFIYQKCHKEDPGNYRPVSPTLVPGNVMEEVAMSEAACVGLPGNQAQPAWVHERQVLLGHPHLLL